MAEKRDVPTDYRRLFGDEAKSPAASGIGVLTDSDNTHSHAVGDYAGITLSVPRAERIPDRDGAGSSPFQLLNLSVGWYII